MQTLSGDWKLATDPGKIGREEGWWRQARPDAVDALVPGVIQQALPAYHGVAWYWHSFHTAEGIGSDGPAGGRVLIRFGAVDYLGEVWLNGQYAGSHEGGETPFEFDVTDAIRWSGDNLLAVRVLNPTNTPIDGYVLGEYPACFRLLGPRGIEWEKIVKVSIPDPSPLAVPVLLATMQVDGPPGVYTLAANLEQGGAPAGGRLILHVSDSAALPLLSGAVALWGIDPRVERWLVKRGLSCRPLGASENEQGELIVVGLPPESERTPEGMADLTRRLAAGATVIFLNSSVFGNGADSTAFLPLVRRGRTYTATDWLYHKECVSRRHPVFDGLQGPGIMDWDYYGPVVPHEIYEGLDAPDEMIAASFAVGHHRYPTGYAWGLLIGAFRHGAGTFILSTPHILENLDSHPAADRLLIYLIRHAQGPQFSTAPLPKPFSQETKP